MHGPLHAIDQPFTELIEIAGIARVGHDNNKLITAQAGHQISAAHVLLEDMRHFLEHFIAHGMTQGVVDRFEPVHVQVQQCQGLAIGPVQVFAQAIEQAIAVGQPGQWIMQGQVLDLGQCA
ncbi:hypothetical protein D3C78_1587830 [compost metagenome]